MALRFGSRSLADELGQLGNRGASAQLLAQVNLIVRQKAGA
jgi:hypothetical protein